MPVRGVALAGAVCGVYLLRAAWRKRVGCVSRIGCGWSLLAGSVMGWSCTSGADKGTALGIIAAVLIVLAFLLSAYVRAERRPVRAIGLGRSRPDREGRKAIVRRIWAIFLIGPGAGFSSLGFSTSGFVGLRAIGVEHTMNLALVMFAFPLVWGVLAVVGGYGRSIWKKSLAVLLAGLLPFAYLTMASQR